jgi:hypothetical protein
MMISLTFLYRIKNSFPTYTVKVINHGTTFELQSGSNTPIVFIPTVLQSEIENFINLTPLLQIQVVAAVSTDINAAITANYFTKAPTAVTTLMHNTQVYGNKISGDTIVIQ